MTVHARPRSVTGRSHGPAFGCDRWGACGAAFVEFVCQPLARGRTLLHCLRDTQEHLVRPLINLGRFTVNAQDLDGNTPLHVAAGDGQTAVLRMLVMCSADPSVRNRAGRDALICAVRSKANTMVRPARPAHLSVRLDSTHQLSAASCHYTAPLAR